MTRKRRDDPDHIRPKAAATLLGCGLQTVYNLIHAGELRGYQVGGRYWIEKASCVEYRERHSFGNGRGPEGAA